MKDLMKRASEAYYNGEPFISNEEYDALEEMYGQIIAGAGEISHKYRMYSLKKHYEKDGQPPLNVSDCIETPKLDGAAVSLLYAEGKLALALTRGDGKKGRDITDKMKFLVPNTVQNKHLHQVEGEVVASRHVDNSRNYASGALNKKDINEFKARVVEGDMVFVAYGVKPTMQNTYTESLDSLVGFNVITSFNCDNYPTDGRVFRLNDNNEFSELGYTEKFPRGAFAWKDEQDAVETTLLDVVWRTGKTGKVTPIAILEPVIIGEANISRATLNNIAYIEALQLEKGCRVKLIRSGEIIPKIIGRVFD